MQISLTNTGKRYNRDWIFRRFSFVFQPGKSYAITGPNGSGKSTLLQVIAGSIMQSEGSIQYHTTKLLEPSEVYRHISIAAPYLDLIEEMTATELLQFHHTFKPLTTDIPFILAEVGLEKAAHKQIRYFSSGMKQRLKLAQAMYSDTAILFLDEPTTNLDAEGAALYRRLVASIAGSRTVIVSSNDPQEYDFCEEVISINDYK